MKLMVLGGGNCQQNFIQSAKALGHYVVLVDYLPHCPATQWADVHELISTFDTPGVLKAAKKHAIDGIVTLGTDQPVLTAASVAEKLGLHSYVNRDTALAVTNKRIMKQMFRQNQIPMADYRLIREDFDDKEVEGLLFPAVLKPVDSQGQRGIFLVKDISDIRHCIKHTLEYSREDSALLEEYYPSDEITVNGWVNGGKVTLISVVDRVTMKSTNQIGICVAHNFPSVHLADRYDEIEALTNCIVKSFGILDGPLYFQYLFGEDGIKVNEIAMRIGGAYEDITIPMISGIDIAGMVMEYVQNGKTGTSHLESYHLRSNKKAVSTQLFFCKPGRINEITPKETLQKLPGVRAVYYAIKEGGVVPEIENATARAGYIIVEGRDFNDMINKVNNVFECIAVLDEKGNNLVIKYSEYKDKYLFYRGGRE